jgi:ABC-type multidrug transport system ATPase subunit
VLANRICVMSHGKVIALDTPNNIKRRFGVGYNLFLEPTNVNEMSPEQIRTLANRARQAALSN